jgi:hypothetical protein
VADEGEAELRFGADENVEILTALRSNQKTKEDLERYVIHRVEKNEIVINVRLPEKDDYALDLFARRRDEKNDNANETLKNVCSYLISAMKPAADSAPYPKVPNGRFGQIKTYPSSFQVKSVSHPSAFITAPDNGDQLELTMEVSPADSTELLTELVSYDGNTEKKLDQHTHVDVTDDGQVTVAVRFPKRGQYVLNIYGRNEETDGKSNSFSLAYRYLIRVDRATEPCSPFPVTYERMDKTMSTSRTRLQQSHHSGLNYSLQCQNSTRTQSGSEGFR